MSQLFEQSDINGMILANRFVRSATWDGMATDEGGPFFPLGTEDHVKVSRAIADLLDKQAADKEKE